LRKTQGFLNYSNGIYFLREDFFEEVLRAAAPGLDEVRFAAEDLDRLALEDAGALAVDEDLAVRRFELLEADFDLDALEALVAVRFARGSAILSLRPGSTRIPEGMLFQLRNWASDTPKRSAMVTRVSPRRAV
jgi:hypothetical protein